MLPLACRCPPTTSLVPRGPLRCNAGPIASLCTSPVRRSARMGAALRAIPPRSPSRPPVWLPLETGLQRRDGAPPYPRFTMRPLPYWATVLAIGAALALRVDLRAAIAMPLSGADLRGLQTCGAVSPTGVLRIVHQRIADRCAPDWLASQLPVDGDAGWTKRLQAAFDGAQGDDVWQLRIAHLIVHQDGPLPMQAGPLLRRHPDDPIANAVLAGSHRGAGWIDPILDDRRAALAWARASSPVLPARLRTRSRPFSSAVVMRRCCASCSRPSASGVASSSPAPRRRGPWSSAA